MGIRSLMGIKNLPGGQEKFEETNTVMSSATKYADTKQSQHHMNFIIVIEYHKHYYNDIP